MTKTDDNVNAVRLMKEFDKRVTYQQIRTSLDISMSQVHKILHKYFAVRKLCSRCIPCNLTEAQKLNCVNWCREIMQRFGGGDSNADVGIGYSLTHAEEWGGCRLTSGAGPRFRAERRLTAVLVLGDFV
ncbi:hypothetical protein EVAR_21701_1 [Eumeta japonica]|uniref:Mariner Mos1 transposase n=1 Tax=Eumeta variegata TaxID=151549 RepID=A0A4C1W4W6_EUMVA|nr:hypothetical protein EVAR_21701_1 [Eumeta japonica]